MSYYQMFFTHWNKIKKYMSTSSNKIHTKIPIKERVEDGWKEVTCLKIEVEDIETVKIDPDVIFYAARVHSEDKEERIIHSYKYTKIGKNVRIIGRSNIYEGVEIGENTKIDYSTYIEKYTKIGKNVIIQTNVIIEGETVIGDNTKIYEGAKIGENVRIGKGVIIKRNVYIPDKSVIGDNSIIE